MMKKTHLMKKVPKKGPAEKDVKGVIQKDVKKAIQKVAVKTPSKMQSPKYGALYDPQMERSNPPMQKSPGKK